MNGYFEHGHGDPRIVRVHSKIYVFQVQVGHNGFNVKSGADPLGMVEFVSNHAENHRSEFGRFSENQSKHSCVFRLYELSTKKPTNCTPVPAK